MMKPFYEDIAFMVYPVSDMLRARAFYAGTLDLEETENWDDVWVEYDIGHGTLAITNTFLDRAPGAKGPMLAIEVSDIGKVGEALKAKGLAWATGPFDSPACGGFIPS